MIRAALHRLTTTPPPASPQLALTVARPVGVFLVETYPAGRRWLSTNPKRQNNDLPNKNSSDSFDERGSIEKEKKNEQHRRPPAHYKGHVFPPLFRGFDDFFAPSIFGRDMFAPYRRAERLFDQMMPMLETPFLEDVPSTTKTLLRSSPGYEIKESKEAYEISVNVPDGLQASDMEIELENDGTVLHVSGECKVEEGDVVSQSWFDKRFVIGPNVDTTKFAANFYDGVLVMTAPKLEVRAEEKTKHTIPITEKPHITDEELVEGNYSDAFDESDWAETGKAANLEKEKQ